MARRRPRNYNLFGNYTYYLPAVSDIFILLLWLLLGAIVGGLVTMPFALALPQEKVAEYTTVLSYPLMFIPAMIYCSIKSRSRSFSHPGVLLNSAHFGNAGGLVCALLTILATLAAGFCADFFVSILPPMPSFLEEALRSLTGGNFWINFLCVSIMAPFFEEWLCRGTILRGLLHHNVKPVWAIIISAVFFAFIHLNPWQAIPAFIFGCVFGYIYYKTGSLLLTMLAHFTNNTFSLIMSQLDAFDGSEYWTDILQPQAYWIIYLACALLLVLIFNVFKRIPLESPAGNSDKQEPLIG